MNPGDCKENIEVKHQMDGRMVNLEGFCVWNYDDFNNPEAEVKEIHAYDDDGLLIDIKPEHKEDAREAVLNELFNYLELANGGQ